MKKNMLKYWLTVPRMFTGGLIVAAATWTAWSQTAPGLTIAHSPTNQVSITISNAIPAASYELWWTPNLGDSADYPWTMAAAGGIGQTNFVLTNWEYPSVFFRGLLDTNAIPLWQAAQPNNQAAGILKVTIANPTNGMTLN